MPASRRSMGVYQPRSRRAAFTDALADARRTVARAIRIALLRGAGALVFVGACAGHVAHAYAQDWLTNIVPFALLAVGLPLAFFATGLKFMPLVRGVANVPAFFVWLAGRRPQRSREEVLADADDTEEMEAPDEDDDPYGLSVRPEPVAGITRADERRREIRVKREEKKLAKTPKTARQAPLHLGSSGFPLPPLGLLAEPVQQHESSALSDDALEENARMLEAVLADFGVKGRIMAGRPGPGGPLHQFE